jgi:hypothetical protein
VGTPRRPPLLHPASSNPCPCPDELGEAGPVLPTTDAAAAHERSVPDLDPEEVEIGRLRVGVDMNRQAAAAAAEDGPVCVDVPVRKVHNETDTTTRRRGDAGRGAGEWETFGGRGRRTKKRWKLERVNED